jgi:hypothetical protein
MPKKQKALDLAMWRKHRIVVTRDGWRSMTQREFAARVGCGNSLICRIESGERWPSERIWEGIYDLTLLRGDDWRALGRAQLRTWRAYSPDRKGTTP